MVDARQEPTPDWLVEGATLGELAGKIDVHLALPMAVAQILGGLLGARTAIRGGEKVVRGVVLVVTTALALRIGWQIASG